MRRLWLCSDRFPSMAWIEASIPKGWQVSKTKSTMARSTLKAAKAFLREGVDMGMFPKEAAGYVDALFAP